MKKPTILNLSPREISLDLPPSPDVRMVTACRLYALCASLSDLELSAEIVAAANRAADVFEVYCEQ